MIEFIKNIISSVSDFFVNIKNLITSFANLFISICDFLPDPFGKILLSVLAIVIIILILRSVGK